MDRPGYSSEWELLIEEIADKLFSERTENIKDTLSGKWLQSFRITNDKFEAIIPIRVHKEFYYDKFHAFLQLADANTTINTEQHRIFRRNGLPETVDVFIIRGFIFQKPKNIKDSPLPFILTRTEKFSILTLLIVLTCCIYYVL